MNPAALRDLLMRWASVNSGSDNVPGLRQMHAALAAEFRTFPGAQVDAVPLPGTAAEVLRIRIRAGAPVQLLLSGHYDTVYGAEHPFQTCTVLDGETLRGPGVADMKGGIVVLVAALRAFAAHPQAGRLGFEIVLTPDEETGSAASRPVLDALATARRHAMALIFEPARANGDLVRRRKGTGIFTLTCHGRAAHAGRDPSKGRNAILALAECLPAVAALERELPDVTINVGHIRGGGAVNIVPDFAEAQVNVRTTHVADEAAVAARLRQLTEPVNRREGYRLVVSGGFNRPPKDVTPVEEQLFARWQQCARDVGVTLGWQDVGGGSDGNLLARGGLPCLDGLGPVGDRLHSPDEFVRLPSLVERAKVAARFFEAVASGEIALP